MAEKRINHKKTHNGGFSIVELIMVVGIIAIMTALVVPSIAPKYTTAAKTTAAKIDNLLSKGRIRQMSRLDKVEIKFYYVANDGIYGQYVQGGKAQTPERLGGPAVQFCNASGIVLPSQPSLTAPIIVVFDRSTGALKAWSGTTSGIDSEGSATESIFITARSRMSTISIYTITGRNKTLL